MRFLIIQLICWIGCFSTFALAQFDISEGVMGSVTFPALGVTCVANLAVFVTSLTRGRLDLEMGARDVVHILTSPKLFNIRGLEDGNGLTTYDHTREDIEDADVVMLSNGRHNWSNANFVEINLLQILPWEECEGVAVEAACKRPEHSCNCIIFWTVERIMNMLTWLGCVNLICSLGWAVLISFERGADTSPPPTMPTVLLIITAIATAFGMDLADLIITYWDSKRLCGLVFIIVSFCGFSAVALPLTLISREEASATMFTGVVNLESVYIVAGSAVASTLGIKGFWRWVYAALQLLIWVKWACGSIFLNRGISADFSGTLYGRLFEFSGRSTAMGES